MGSGGASQADVKDHLQYLDENNVVYPCGHNTVVYNMETREQSLIHGMHAGMAVEKGATPQDSEEITALAITPNRRFIGVAERCADRGVVNIYDAQSYRRRRVLNYAELGSKEVVCIAFSADSKQVLTLGGSPDWTLVLWTTDRTAKVTATIKLGGHAGPAPGLAATVRVRTNVCEWGKSRVWNASHESYLSSAMHLLPDGNFSGKGHRQRRRRNCRTGSSRGCPHPPGRFLSF
jgi:WD40 repeat protein